MAKIPASAYKVPKLGRASMMERTVELDLQPGDPEDVLSGGPLDGYRYHLRPQLQEYRLHRWRRGGPELSNGRKQLCTYDGKRYKVFWEELDEDRQPRRRFLAYVGACRTPYPAPAVDESSEGNV